jgi:hypothetical protein
MCGPWGHGYVAPSVFDRREDEDDGSGRLATLPEPEPKTPGDQATPEISDFARRRLAALKGWKTRKEKLKDAISKGSVQELPSGTFFLPGYQNLNSHHEIRSVNQSLDIHEPSRYLRNDYDNWLACGIVLGNGRLMIQDRCNVGFSVSAEDEQLIEQHWAQKMKGQFSAFVDHHAGRLGDLSEWKSDFHSWLDPVYVLKKLPGQILRERYLRYLDWILMDRTFNGIPIPGENLVVTGRAIRPDELRDEQIHLLRKWLPPRSLLRKLEDLWPNNKTALERLKRAPNDFVSTLLN